MFSMAEMYRWGQKEGIESAVIWMLNKIKIVSSHIPEGMDAEQAKRKLMKIIGGVLIHEMDVMGTGVPQKNVRKGLIRR